MVDIIGKTIHEQEVIAGRRYYPIKLEESNKEYYIKINLQNEKVKTHKIIIVLMKYLIFFSSFYEHVHALVAWHPKGRAIFYGELKIEEKFLYIWFFL